MLFRLSTKKNILPFSFKHKYVNCKVRHLNDKVKSRNAKSITSNCTNNKSICDTKCFQKCTSSASSFRSHYVKFICDKNSQNQLFLIGNYQHSNWLCCQHQREREPSRIPAKKICRVLTKSRKLRKAFQKKIKKNIPNSSCVYRYTQAFSQECQKVLSYKCFDQFIKTKLNWKTPLINCKVGKKKEAPI